MDSDLDNIQGIEFDESSNDVPNDSTDLEGSLSSLSFVSDGDSPFNGKRRRSIRPGSRREGLVPLEEEENFLGEDVYLLSNKTEEQYGDHRPWVRAKKDIRTHFKQILSSLYNHKISLSIYLLLLLSVILLFFFNKSWETLSLAGIVSILVLISESMLLVANVMPSSFVFLFGLAIFWLSGILDDSDALSGFSNPGVLLVASSSVISRVLEFTRVYKYLFTTVFLKPKGIRLSLCLLLPFMMVVSAFINESAVSGALTNTVVVWGLRSRLSIPQVLLPMLYAILLGSTLTLIGCGTNIVINQLAENDQKNPVSFGIFEQGIVGLPLCVISLSYLVFVSPFLIGSSESDDQKKKISPQVFCGKGFFFFYFSFIFFFYFSFIFLFFLFNLLFFNLTLWPLMMHICIIKMLFRKLRSLTQSEKKIIIKN